MPWLTSLAMPIAEALERFPADQEMALVTLGEETMVLQRATLADMVRMQLGALPAASVAVPQALVRQSPEAMRIETLSPQFSAFFPKTCGAALYELASLFRTAEIPAYLVGGVTRDMLLGRARRFEPGDIDILIEGEACQAARWVSERSHNIRLVQEFPDFGTAKLRYKNEVDIDFAATRREVYAACGALPEVVAKGVPLTVDLQRRDFSVNALALSLVETGQVLDGVGGLADLADRRIRLLKTASFFEDPSRILRAVCYAQRLDFQWGVDTHWALDQFLTWMPGIYKGGGDRIQTELLKILSAPESLAKRHWLHFFCAKGLHRLLNTQITRPLALPISLERFQERIPVLMQALDGLAPPSFLGELYLHLLLAGLPETDLPTTLQRLGLCRERALAVETTQRLLRENRVCLVSCDSDAVQIHETFAPLPFVTACMGVLLSPTFPAPLEALVHYKRVLAPIRLETTGEDILALGVPQGEQVGILRKALHHARLRGEVTGRLDEIQWLQRHLEQTEGASDPNP